VYHEAGDRNWRLPNKAKSEEMRKKKRKGPKRLSKKKFRKQNGRFIYYYFPKIKSEAKDG
jgi:hypothetical protein